MKSESWYLYTSSFSTHQLNEVNQARKCSRMQTWNVALSEERKSIFKWKEEKYCQVKRVKVFSKACEWRLKILHILKRRKVFFFKWKKENYFQMKRVKVFSNAHECRLEMLHFLKRGKVFSTVIWRPDRIRENIFVPAANFHDGRG